MRKMDNRRYLLFIMCCTFVSANINMATLVPSDYDNTLEPQQKDGSPITVGISWHIKGIFSVNFHEMTVKTAMYFRMAWQEPRLKIPPDTFRNTKVVPLHASLLQKVWLPDLYIHEAADITSFSMIQKVQGVFLEDNSTLVFSSLLQAQLSCPMYFAKYPFDVQVCHMTVSSYYFGDDKMKLTFMNLGVSADAEVNGQLPNYNFRLQNNEITTKIWCNNCTFPSSSVGKSQLVFARKYSGHLFTVYFPSSLVVSLAWVSFFWPPDAIPGRTVLIVTSMLTLISMYAAIGQRSPETSYLKAVDVWLVICILHVVLALFQFAVIITIRRRQQEKPAPQIFSIIQNAAVVPARLPLATAPVEGDEGGGLQFTADSSTSRPSSSGLTSVNSFAYKPGVIGIPRSLKLQERQVEKVGQLGFPILFLIFNLIYWPCYLS